MFCTKKPIISSIYLTQLAALAVGFLLHSSLAIAGDRFVEQVVYALNKKDLGLVYELSLGASNPASFYMGKSDIPQDYDYKIERLSDEEATDVENMLSLRGECIQLERPSHRLTIFWSEQSKYGQEHPCYFSAKQVSFELYYSQPHQNRFTTQCSSKVLERFERSMISDIDEISSSALAELTGFLGSTNSTLQARMMVKKIYPNYSNRQIKSVIEQACDAIN